MALSTPRINSRGCRQPCTGIGFLLGGIETASFAYFFVRRSKVRRRFEVRSSVPGFSASNPEQSRKFHSRSRERNRVEGIRNIDKRTRFLSFRCLRKQRKREARPTGRSRATQFHERPPRKTATKYRIKFRNSARLKFDGSAGSEILQDLVRRDLLRIFLASERVAVMSGIRFLFACR